MSARVIRGFVFQNGGASFLARVVGHNGSAITQATLSSITCNVYDKSSSTPDTAILTPTVTIASCVFDTLQTDSRWTKDTTGFNFLHAMPATAFPTANHVYHVLYKFTPVSGADIWADPYEVTAIETDN